MVLGIGTSEGGPIREGKGFASEGGRRVVAKLDREGLLALGRETGALVATVTLDDRDVARIQQGIETHIEPAKGEDAGARYRDFGWYAAPILALAAGLWFRRGFTLRWAAIFACCWLCPAASEGADFHFADLWATRDQQGRYHFERGEFQRAAELFRDPMWKGAACYRAGDYACAVDAFARVDSPEAWYDLGNAYARQGELKLAVEAYDKALAARPSWPDAKANRDLVASRIPRPRKDDDEEGEADPNQKPDEVKFDEKGSKGKRGEVELEAPHRRADRPDLAPRRADVARRLPAPEVRRAGVARGPPRRRAQAEAGCPERSPEPRREATLLLARRSRAWPCRRSRRPRRSPSPGPTCIRARSRWASRSR